MNYFWHFNCFITRAVLLPTTLSNILIVYAGTEGRKRREKLLDQFLLWAYNWELRSPELILISPQIIVDIGNVSSVWNIQIAEVYGVLFRHTFLGRRTTHKVLIHTNLNG
jgi:hypothetical protein